MEKNRDDVKNNVAIESICRFESSDLWVADHIIVLVEPAYAEF